MILVSSPCSNAQGDTRVILTPSEDKGLFDEGHLKSFSIINVWSITSVIALLEMLLFNSIRRQAVSDPSADARYAARLTYHSLQPIVGHVAGTIFASSGYIAWA